MGSRRSDSDDNRLIDFMHLASPDLFAKTALFAKVLSGGRARGFASHLCPVLEYRGGRALVDGGEALGCREVVVMCSADYLGLARHPDVVRAAIEALRSFGANVASVPLMAGSTGLHQELQRALAKLAGTNAAVLFPTGYDANAGVIAALCRHGDVVVADQLVHHSILDGIRLSGAARVTFRHSDVAHLEEQLAGIRGTHPQNGLLVVIEGVYGIDGDLAPLPEIAALARQFDARVLVDDAHATGVIGRTGRGSVEHFHDSAIPDLIMGSLSKALGGAGGWIACAAPVADYLRYFAKTLVMSVGLPAASAAAALASMDLLQREPELMARLRENAAFLRNGLTELGIGNARRSESAILSALVGGEDRLRAVNRDLFRRGVWAEALPFPLVPRGQERIRFRVSAAHTHADLQMVLDAMACVIQEHDLAREDRRL